MNATPRPLLFRGDAVMLGARRCVLLGRAGVDLARNLAALGHDAEQASSVRLDTPQAAQSIVFVKPALPQGMPPWVQPMAGFDAMIALRQHTDATLDEAMFIGALGRLAGQADFITLALPRVRTAEAPEQARAVAALLAAHP